MIFNNNVIKKQKKISFLVCNNNLSKFYMKNSWKKINKNKFQLLDHKFIGNGMIYNNIKKINKNNQKLRFYINK